MLKRWNIYLFVLILSVLFYGIYEGYESYYVLLLTLFFPLLSLGISLYGMLRVKIYLKELPFELKKDAQQQVAIHIDSRSRIPLPLITLNMTEQNITVDSKATNTYIQLNDCINTIISVPLYSQHVGCVEVSLDKIRVYDYLGLFCIPVTKPGERSVYILPHFITPEPFPILPKDKACGKGQKPKPGGGFAEDYDLRNYREGDPLNSIHWKLSSKLDQLIIREPLISEKGKIYICLNLYGEPDIIDNILGQVFYISHLLLKKMIEFNICWYDTDEKFRSIPICDKNDFYGFISEAYSKPIKATGKPIDANAVKNADWYYIISPTKSEVENERIS